MSDDEEDRISSLPDDILCHILSFLPTKYSFRTRLLSTRWINLFAFVPVLDFYADHYYDPASLIEFVNNVFMLYQSPQMTKFRLLTRQIFPMQPDGFASWVSSALYHNVQELDIFVQFEEDKTLPSEIFSSGTLSVLKLSGNFKLKLQSSAFLPSLKTLHLRDVYFDHSARMIFLICPVLEDLCLEDCHLDELEVLDITHPILKKLQIEDCRSLCVELVLNTPSLVCFEYNESINRVFRGKSDLTSLVKAVIEPRELDDYELDVNFVAELLAGVSYATHLYLSTVVIEAFSGSIEAVPTFHKLTRLEMTNDVSCAAFDMLPNILDKCSLLEVLIFDYGFSDHDTWRGSDACDLCGRDLNDNDINCYENVPACVLRLKEIEFRRFTLGKIEQKMVTYFLKHARVLEKMIIQTQRGWRKKPEFSNKISTFPRSSRDCQIMVIWSGYSGDETEFCFSTRK